MNTNISLCGELTQNNQEFKRNYDDDTIIISSIKNYKFDYIDLITIQDRLPFFSGIILVYDNLGLFYKPILQALNDYKEDEKKFVINSFKIELESFAKEIFNKKREITEKHKNIINGILNFLNICDFIDNQFYNQYYDNIGN